MTRSINQVVTDYEQFLDTTFDLDRDSVAKGVELLNEANALGYQLYYKHASPEDFVHDPSGYVQAKSLSQ